MRTEFEVTSEPFSEDEQGEATMHRRCWNKWKTEARLDAHCVKHPWVHLRMPLLRTNSLYWSSSKQTVVNALGTFCEDKKQHALAWRRHHSGIGKRIGCR